MTNSKKSKRLSNLLGECGIHEYLGEETDSGMHDVWMINAPSAAFRDRAADWPDSVVIRVALISGVDENNNPYVYEDWTIDDNPGVAEDIGTAVYKFDPRIREAVTLARQIEEQQLEVLMAEWGIK